MTKVDISCLCGKSRTTAQLRDTIPVASFLCHQSQCRWNLGALCHSALPIVDRPEDSLTRRLRVFEPRSGLSRYFCPTCGSHLFESEDGWRVQSGVVEKIHSEQVFHALERIAGHRFVHETVDGGLSVSLTGPTDLSVHPPQTIQPGSPDAFLRVPQTIPEAVEDHARLWARCLCGGVEFYITRPDATSGLCSSPWPDLIVPYFQNPSAENPEDEKWWIRDSGKWLAGTCACRSCRLSLGAPIQAWAFISKSNIFCRDGSALTYDLDMLQSFESSPGAAREFCRRCGATVFWHNIERPGVVDVSIGLLRATDGVLAKNWLHWWTQRVSFAEEAFDEALVALLQSNLNQLGAE